jgi:pyrroline-5-carboxylate reductase
MNSRNLGFIGGGRVTRIILEGLRRAGALNARVVVSDPSEPTLAKLRQRLPEIELIAGDNTAAAAQDLVFLAVHPPAITDVAREINGSLPDHALVVSLAPKFTIARLTDLLGGFNRIVRVIPNAPSIVNAGFNPAACSPAVSMTDRESVRTLFEPLGEFFWADEPKLEGYAILSGMGPTYFWFQLYELLDLAPACGLEAEEAQRAIERMMTGALHTMASPGLSPADVMDLIPAKPLGEMEASVKEMYRSRLPALFQKIRP